MYGYNDLYNPLMNPYMPNPSANALQQQQPRMEVVKVNGENGARAFPIGANSSALLLDESGTIVWLVVTDGAGYKTVSPYDITPHQTAQAPDVSGLEQRIARLEEFVNGFADDTATTRNEQSSQSANQSRPNKTNYSGT
jgi:hypothetical protein